MPPTDLFTTHRGAVAFADVTPLPQRAARLVRDDSDAGTACVLTRTLFERKDDLVRANAAAAGIDLRGARDTAPVPLHRGSAAALDALSAR
ncbi:MAG TPA: TAXI family TRAP transporter solute-binding subunit [Mycobacteriales bacterium]|nr:TAXI family TRAP transporter solute-binding subunit [Mycobacteriales bacterium]